VPPQVKRWLGLTSGEETFAHPRVTARYASAMLAFVVVLAFLIPDGPLRLDERWGRLMTDAETSFLTHIALVFNAIGHGILRALTTAGIGLVLLIKNRRAALLAFILAEALTPLLVNLIKLIVGRERPPGAMIEAHGSSYPSGHAAYASATAVILVLLFTKPGKHRRAWWAAAAVATAGMAWSRSYLHAHWLSDVVAGAILGVGVALLSLAVVQILSTRWRGEDDQPSRPIAARASSTSS
jgi:membrane-associated phospholipid phosphatase